MINTTKTSGARLVLYGILGLALIALPLAVYNGGGERLGSQDPEAAPQPEPALSPRQVNPLASPNMKPYLVWIEYRGGPIDSPAGKRRHPIGYELTVNGARVHDPTEGISAVRPNKVTGESPWVYRVYLMQGETVVLKVWQVEAFDLNCRITDNAAGPVPNTDYVYPTYKKTFRADEITCGWRRPISDP